MLNWLRNSFGQHRSCLVFGLLLLPMTFNSPENSSFVSASAWACSASATAARLPVMTQPVLPLPFCYCLVALALRNLWALMLERMKSAGGASSNTRIQAKVKCIVGHLAVRNAWAGTLTEDSECTWWLMTFYKSVEMDHEGLTDSICVHLYWMYQLHLLSTLSIWSVTFKWVLSQSHWTLQKTEGKKNCLVC